MRDVAVMMLFVYLIIYTFRRPFIGVGAWAWISLAYPAGWAWGFSTNFRMNFTVAILTFIGYFALKNKPKVEFDSLIFLVIVFWVLAFISSSVTESFLVDHASVKFEEFTKVLMLFAAIILIFSKKIHVDVFIWSVVLAISSYAAMESVKYIVSGGGHRIAGFEGHVLGDRNDLAVAINMTIPLILYLASETKHSKLRMGLYVLVGMNILAIIGTFSRGGFVGLVLLGMYFYWQSKRKALWSIVIAVCIGISTQMGSSEWSNRMDTVSSASSADSSFIGRIWAWKISVKIANDNVFGNSFFATQDPYAWHRYRQSIDNFGPVYTPPIPEGQFPKAAHSLYFQVLGDLGYIGLFVYLMLLSSLFFKIKKLGERAKAMELKWAINLTTMLSVSIVGYCITGANVSMAYFDLLFGVIGIVYVLDKRLLVNKETHQ